MKKKVIAVIGFCGLMLSSVSGMNLAYEVENGFTGMKRDIVVTLCVMMPYRFEVRNMIGMSQEHLAWGKNNKRLPWDKHCLPTEANRLRISERKPFSDIQIKAERSRLGIDATHEDWKSSHELFTKFDELKNPTPLTIASFTDAYHECYHTSAYRILNCPNPLAGIILDGIATYQRSTSGWSLGKPSPMASLARLSRDLTDDRIAALTALDAISCRFAQSIIYVHMLDNQRGGRALQLNTKNAFVWRYQTVMDRYHLNLVKLLTKVRDKDTNQPLVCLLASARAADQWFNLHHLPAEARFAYRGMAQKLVDIHQHLHSIVTTTVCDQPLDPIKLLGRTNSRDLIRRDFRKEAKTLGLPMKLLEAAWWEYVIGTSSPSLDYTEFLLEMR